MDSSSGSDSLIETQTKCAYVLIAATVLIVYDYAITIAKEYHTIWTYLKSEERTCHNSHVTIAREYHTIWEYLKSKGNTCRKSHTTIATLIARWVLLCQAAGYLAEVLRTSLQSCQAAYWISAISQLVGWALVDYLIVGRIWALCHRKLTVPIICAVLGFVPVVTNSAAVAGYRRTYEPDVPGCVKTWVRLPTEHFERNYTIAAYVTCFSVLCRDATAVGLTLHRTYKHWRLTKRGGASCTRTTFFFLRAFASRRSCLLPDYPYNQRGTTGDIQRMPVHVASTISWMLTFTKGSVTAGEILNPLIACVPLILLVRLTMDFREDYPTRQQEPPPAQESATPCSSVDASIAFFKGERAAGESVGSIQMSPTSVTSVGSSNIV